MTLFFVHNFISTRFLIVALFAIVLTLEYATPSAYVFGYLYIGPIVIASARLSRRETFQITLIAVLLTLSNLWIPTPELPQLPTISNRLIAIAALVVTGILSDRNRRSQDAIAQQQAQLQTQQQLARLREDFVSTLTHDLKTPLLGAIETLKVLKRGELGAIPPAQQPIFDTMIRSHSTTLHLVEMALDVYRNDAEGLELDLQPIDLSAIATDAIAPLQPLAASRRVYLNLSYGDSDFRTALWVMGDAFQLQRVFTNLITNAINHSPRGGKVEIRLESYSSYQIVRVLDAGLGITAEELPQLFERFYQSDRQAKGSGLGLYLSRQIIEAHGGTIWAENRVPNGAVFAFRLSAVSLGEDRANFVS